MQLPPRPTLGNRDAQTPVNLPTGKAELAENTEAIGRLVGEIGQLTSTVDGVKSWCATHDIMHTASDARMDGLQRELTKLEKAQRDHTTAEIKRRPLTTRQVIGYGTAVAGVIGALFGGASQLLSTMTATARAQSAEVAVQKVEARNEEIDYERLQMAYARGRDDGKAAGRTEVLTEVTDAQRKADRARVAAKRGQR